MTAHTDMPVPCAAALYRERCARTRDNYGMREVWPYLMGRRVLDLGCGDGGHLARLGPRSVGVDCAPNNVLACHRKGLSVLEYDINQPLPFEDDSFEAVLLSHVLEHTESPLQTLREARRVCVPGGYIVVGLPVEKTIWRLVRREHFFHNHKTHLYGISPECLEALSRFVEISVLRQVLTYPWLKWSPSLHALANRMFGLPGQYLATVCWTIGRRPARHGTEHRVSARRLLPPKRGQ